jgi:predicted DNA-binding transcriptional regulator AlpA
LTTDELINVISLCVRAELRASDRLLKTKFLSLKEVAGLLGVNQSTIHRWRKAGKLPRPFVEPWGGPRWAADEIAKCIKRD